MQVPVREFHTGPYETVVGPGELLVEIRVPVRSGGGSAPAGSRRGTASRRPTSAGPPTTSGT